MKETNFQVDIRLAKLLSANYRSSERALKELIDNAWDADSTTVNITLPEILSQDPIIIHDNGTGMTLEGLESDYLNIARNRREMRGNKTSIKNRRVKGKNGIGKFAGLSTASTMKLETWSGGSQCSFTLDSLNFDKSKDIERIPIEILTKNCPKDIQGTRVTLIDLHQGLAFPDPDKLRQLLIQEYGRENDFRITINNKILGIDDIKGIYTNHSFNLKNIGKVNLEFTVASQKSKLKKPGISIRGDGKTIGEPTFFGLRQAEGFPTKLLDKIYGEVEIENIEGHITVDWGAMLENSDIYQALQDKIQPIIIEKVRETYSQEMRLAQARLQKKVNNRLAKLPQHKRHYATKAIKAVLDKYYGEPESKLEPIVSVLLDALERSDYRSVLDYIHAAKHSDIARLAEILNEFGITEIAIIGEQAKSRLEFLDHLETLCENSGTLEHIIHSALEKNLWVFGVEFSLFSSNRTLKKIIEKYLGQKYTGNRASKRPDLLLNQDYTQRYLLLEFKRPKHSLTFDDYQQATAYRNDIAPFTDAEISVQVIGGKRSNSLPPLKNQEPHVSFLVYTEIISNARNQLKWLLTDLK